MRLFVSSSFGFLVHYRVLPIIMCQGGACPAFLCPGSSLRHLNTSEKETPREAQRRPQGSSLHAMLIFALLILIPGKPKGDRKGPHPSTSSAPASTKNEPGKPRRSHSRGGGLCGEGTLAVAFGLMHLLRSACAVWNVVFVSN